MNTKLPAILTAISSFVDVDQTAYPEGAVTLLFSGLELSNSSDSPVYVANIGDECVINAKADTLNTISDGTSYTNADGKAGAIYSCDDLKIKGKGTLNVYEHCEDGIVSKNDLRISTERST
ncbi:MAG: carbohydrate-binding domain-containing protein [Porcipelethomonas sp.]